MFPSVLKLLSYIFPALNVTVFGDAHMRAHSCPALCDSMDCSPPGSSVHGILLPLKEVTITVITPTIVWPKQQRGYKPCPSTENWIKDLLSMVPSIRTRPSFPHSHSLPSGNFHKPLILIHQRTDRMKTTIIENWPNWSHGPQPCLTQWNYESCPVGPLKMDGSW